MKSLTPTQTQTIGTALMELLDGKLTDETIQQINTLKRDEICHPTEHIIGFILGSWSQVENCTGIRHKATRDGVSRQRLTLIMDAGRTHVARRASMTIASSRRANRVSKHFAPNTTPGRRAPLTLPTTFRRTHERKDCLEICL